jgi:indole-3-glycerol phosphate synthase
LAKQNILERIFATNREHLEQVKQAIPLALVRAKADAAPATVDLYARLHRPGMQIVAEIKKASPVKGTFAAELDHVGLARTYARAGAAVISVITEEFYFQGHLGLLVEIRPAIEGPGRPVLLRKDFIFDPYQVYEARAAGADAILLIVAMLDATQLRDLLELSRELGMESQVEVHDEREVETALASGARVIGVNNRDLRTFEVDLGTTERLRPLVPADCVLISESGIQSRADVERLERAGANAIHVGEALMLAADPAAKIAELLGRPTGTSASGQIQGTSAGLR